MQARPPKLDKLKLVYISIGFIFVLAALLGSPPLLSDQWIFAGIIFLGIPHGAFDPMLAFQMFRLNSKANWILFTSIYFLLSGLMIVVWRISPEFFLVFFITISIYHFALDVSYPRSIYSILIAGSLFILPAILHHESFQNLLGLFLNSTKTLRFVQTTRMLASPWLILCVMFVLFKRLKTIDRLTATMTILLGLFSPILVAFGVYFCVLHSPRHVIQMMHIRRPKMDQTAIIWRGWVPTFLVLVFIFAVMPSSFNTTVGILNRNWVTYLFVGLSALAFPHLVLVELYRHRNSSAVVSSGHDCSDQR